MITPQTYGLAKRVLQTLVWRLNHGQHRSRIDALEEEVNELRVRAQSELPGVAHVARFPEAQEWWPCDETLRAVRVFVGVLTAATEAQLEPARTMIERAFPRVE